MTSLASTLHFVIPPSQIRDYQSIEELINSDVFCRGELVLPLERTATSLGLGSELAADLFLLYPPVYLSVSGVNGTIDYTQSDSDAAMNQLMWGEVDFAIVSSKPLSSVSLSLFRVMELITVCCVIVNVSVLAASSIGHVIHQQIDYGARQTVPTGMVIFCFPLLHVHLCRFFLTWLTERKQKRMGGVGLSSELNCLMMPFLQML
jgi:hypothetical protein